MRRAREQVARQSPCQSGMMGRLAAINRFGERLVTPDSLLTSARGRSRPARRPSSSRLSTIALMPAAETQRPAVRVMVVDDHDGMRSALSDLVAASPGFELVAEAASGEQALVVARRAHPALVLMDVQMPGIGGLLAARELTREASSMVVVLVSADPDHTLDAPAYGAAALLDKRHLRPGSLATLWHTHGRPAR
jgi:two-component system invasion response regulator UvrY